MPKSETYSNSIPWVMAFIGFGLTVACTYWLASTEKYQAIYQQEVIKSQREAAAIYFNNNCSVATFSREQVADCYKNSLATARELERSGEDLRAQKEMAEWAKGALIVSFLTLGASVIGVVFVWFTLRETRKTTRAAIDAALEAAKANEASAESNRISKSQTRANLTIAGAKFSRDALNGSAIPSFFRQSGR